MQHDDAIPILPLNRFPDCLFMKLKSTELRSNRSDILLTINFNEQKLQLRLGTVWFGLQGGDLELAIKNGTIPYESRVLKSPLNLSISTKRIIEISDTQKLNEEELASGSLGFSGLKGDGSVKASLKQSRSQKGKDVIKDEFQYTKCQITTKGTEESPVWNFKCETGEEILRNSLVDEKLGTVYVSEKPCCIDAIFVASSKHLHVTYAENFWSRDITNNKRSIIKLLINRHLRKALKPYLSKDRVQYEH